MTQSLDDTRFILKSHVETKTGELIMIDIRYVEENERELRRGRHLVLERDANILDEVISETIETLKRLQYLNHIMGK